MDILTGYIRLGQEEVQVPPSPRQRFIGIIMCFRYCSFRKGEINGRAWFLEHSITEDP